MVTSPRTSVYSVVTILCLLLVCVNGIEGDEEEFSLDALDAMAPDILPVSPLSDMEAAKAMSKTSKLNEQIHRDFETQGFIYLKGFVKVDVINKYRPVIREVVKENAEIFKAHDRLHNPHEDAVHQFDRIYNLWEKKQSLKAFTLSRRFAKLAADLLKVDAVRMYEDQSFFKDVGHHKTLWHDDVVSCPFHGGKFVTIWVPLHDLSEEMGGSMIFAEGSHNNTEHLKLPPPARFDDKTIEARFKLRHSAFMPVGDVTVHHGFLLHAATENKDPDGRTREAIAIQFFADGSVLKSQKELDELDPSDEPTTKRWLHKFKPGERVACPELPLAYRRPEPLYDAPSTDKTEL